MYRAYDPDQDKLVAVKLFRLDLPPERAHQCVAELERLIAADLAHAAIAAPLGAGIVDVSPYLAQDFVAADSLDTVVREHGPAPVGEAIRIVTQLAGALDFAAVVDVVHGALHPRDVLISPDAARMTGFGITRALERVGVQAPVRRPYTAPERAAGRSWDRRADVFSLVALAHELLWGRRITATGAEAAAALGDVPGAKLDALRVVFARGLADDPSNRFVTALEFAEALKSSFSRQSTVVSRQSSRLTTTDRRLSTAEPLLPLDGGEPDDTVATTVGEADDDATVPTDPPTMAADEDTVPTPPGVDLDDTIATGEEEHDDFDIAAVLNRADESAARDDLVLRGAEAARFDEVETAPSVIDPPVEETQPSSSADIIVSPSPGRPMEPAPDVLAASQPVISNHRDNREKPAKRANPAYLVNHANRANLVNGAPLNSARSAVWPLALALVVGLALGFAGGYWLGQSERMSERAAIAAREESGTEVSLSPPAAAAGTPETEVRLLPSPSPRFGGPGKPDATSEGSGAPQDGSGVRLQPDLGARGTAPGAAATANVAPPAVPSAVEPTPAPATAPPAAAPRLAPAIARSGRITVRTTPAGARVLIDGRDVGTTPLTVPNLARGAHIVRVMRDGYTTGQRRVNITAAQPSTTLTLRLLRAAGAPAARAETPAARQTASLMVESRPGGALVLVDGRRVGTTPMSIASISIGAHAVRIELNGYKAWTSSVRVVAGEKNRVAASLER